NQFGNLQHGPVNWKIAQMSIDCQTEKHSQSAEDQAKHQKGAAVERPEKRNLSQIGQNQVGLASRLRRRGLGESVDGSRQQKKKDAPKRARLTSQGERESLHQGRSSIKKQEAALGFRRGNRLRYRNREEGARLHAAPARSLEIGALPMPATRRLSAWPANNLRLFRLVNPQPRSPAPRRLRRILS